VLAVLFGALSGALFGVLAIAVRWGLRRPGVDPEAGALAVMCTAVVVVAIGALVESGPFHAGDLWPFLVSGALVPGVSQILFILAIRDAGPSRASVLIGIAPLLSVLIALTLLGEPAKWETIVGTVLVVGALLICNVTFILGVPPGPAAPHDASAVVAGRSAKPRRTCSTW